MEKKDKRRTFKKNVVERRYEALVRNRSTGELEGMILRGETESIACRSLSEGYELIDIHEIEK